MKALITCLISVLIFNAGFSQQRIENQKPINPPVLKHNKILMENNDSLPVKSFYSSKGNWDQIIDTTWGPGQQLSTKLNIFDTYTSTLTAKFIGFHTLGINEIQWDSIVSGYRSKIDESSSRGAFAALMGKLAYDLCDEHTYAYDTYVLKSPLNPGIPILVLGGYANHFGAVTTTLDDSTSVVLRTIDDHPFGLQPGDIILGYEGVAWKTLVDELLASGVPVSARGKAKGIPKRHVELWSAGTNWHLFDTIDIIKYSTKDTVHLPVYPLLNLPHTTGDPWHGGKNLMWNNEQIAVPGVSMIHADDLVDRSVSYGIIDETNIGYIYLVAEVCCGLNDLTYDTDIELSNALSALEETNGLIIDMRFNWGGWEYEFTKTEGILFNQHYYTFNDLLRCNTTDFSVCPSTNPEIKALFEITGNPPSLWDRPIAVLIGPNCVSMGEATAYFLSYHPMVRFFGKATAGSVSGIFPIESFPEWDLSYGVYDEYLLDQPEIRINGRGYLPDVPVWFNADDVANGIDPVVKKAREWIENLSHAHDVLVQSDNLYFAGGDTITLAARVENPNSHDLSVIAHIADKDGLTIDSTAFFDDGNHNDGETGDGIWGAKWILPSGEKTYAVSVSTKDTASGSLRTLPDVVQFTTMGPVTVESYATLTGNTFLIQNYYNNLNLILRNNGSTGTAKNVGAILFSLDSLAVIGTPLSIPFGNIAPGETAGCQNSYLIRTFDCPVNTQVPILAVISSDGYPLWRDTFYIDVVTNIEKTNNPIARIYPIPTNNLLTIELNSPGQYMVEINSLNGQLLYSDRKEGPTLRIDLSSFHKGVYFITIRSEDFVTTRKIIKL